MSHQNNDERTDAEIMAFSTPMVTHFDHCVYCNQTYPTELGHQCQIRDDYQKWQREELARRHEERRKMVESLTPIVRHQGTFTTDPESGCTVSESFLQYRAMKEQGINEDLSRRIAQDIEANERSTNKKSKTFKGNDFWDKVEGMSKEQSN